MPDMDWLAGGRRKDLAHRAILVAARKQLMTQGLDKFTAEAVARRAGCSRATLYRIAGGKRALLDAVMAQGAADVVDKVAAGVGHLEGRERSVEAIRIGLREIRADAGIHAWVRDSLLNGTLLQSPEAFTGFVQAWAGDGAPSQLESLWIVRVFLQFIAWPAADEETELELLRRFVGPALSSETG